MTSSTVPGPTVPKRGRVVVDPRFRARRIAVRKQAGRRRLRRLLVLVALAAVSLAVVVVFESPVLDVDEVTVRGTQGLDPSVVTEAAGIDIGAPLLLTDLDAAARAVEEHPWIEAAEVSRDLPGGVVLEVTERSPGAVIAAGGTRVLVDPSGSVLATGDPASYPTHVRTDPPFVEVVVPEELASALPAAGGAVPPELQGAVTLADRLHEDPVGSVDSVHLDPTLSLELVEGGTVELGDDSDLQLKVEAFRTVFSRIDRACLDTIDLQVPTHPVVTRSPSC